MAVRPSDSARASDTSYPSFEPHITLLSLPADSQISVAELRGSIQKSGPIQVSFDSVEIGDHFFRSVYIAIKPTSELWALHAHTHKVLKQEPRTPLFPHISLSYITDDDAALGERKRYYRALKDSGRIKAASDGAGVALNCDPGQGEDWLSTFEAAEVWIAECNGPVDTWKILDKIPL